MDTDHLTKIKTKLTDTYVYVWIYCPVAGAFGAILVFTTYTPKLPYNEATVY